MHRVYLDVVGHLDACVFDILIADSLHEYRVRQYVDAVVSFSVCVLLSLSRV